MKVQVSGNTFQNPNVCVCCGGHPETEMPVTASRKEGKRVVHKRAYGYVFPYCRRCIEHVGAARNALATAVCIVGVSFFGAGYFYFFSAEKDFAVFVIASGAVAGILAYAILLARAKSFCATSCVSVHCVVEYVGWYGKVQTFEIASLPYAYLFSKANEKKLLNPNNEIEQWLQSNTQFMPSCKRQSITPAGVV